MECWGYDLVIPPHLEFLESLTAGVGHDLALQIFKVTDQLDRSHYGVKRADTTPAVARIDAHNLTDEVAGPVRLCYAGSVFHTMPGFPWGFPISHSDWVRSFMGTLVLRVTWKSFL